MFIHSPFLATYQYKFSTTPVKLLECHLSGAGPRDFDRLCHPHELGYGAPNSGYIPSGKPGKLT